jgi:hypothetical protein
MNFEGQTNITFSDLGNSEKTTFKKFRQEEWGQIEKKYDNSITENVLDAMCILGNKNESIKLSANNVSTCGDSVYIEIRPQLVKLNLVNKNVKPKLPNVKGGGKKGKGKKGRQKKGLTKDEIIRNNIKKRVLESLDAVVETFSYKRLKPDYGFRSPVAEIRLVQFMYCVQYTVSRKKSESAMEESMYDLVVGIAKTLSNIKDLNGISKIACDDLRYNYDILKQYCNFNYETMFEKYPKLCLSTKYDRVFPMMSIKPYHSQKILMNAIRDKKNDKCLYLYKAMIGSGKTTFSVALNKYVEYLRIGESENQLQVIFACSVEPVRREVCRMAYNKDIPFGIAVMEHNSVRVINNYNCSKDENRILIVADLTTTVELLQKSSNYILFLDEPTVGADQPDDPVTREVVKIMMLAPEKTILSSATLPEEHEIPEIINNFKSKHQGANVFTVYSKEAMIGCEVINFDGSIIAPHNNCKSVDELKFIVQQLKTKSFIDRLYTAPVVYKIRQRMIDHGIKDVIDMEKHFSDIGILCQSEIQKVAIQILEQLISTGDDKLIEDVCKPLGLIEIKDEKVKEDLDLDSDSDSDLGFEWDNSSDSSIKDQSYDLDKMFTTQAHKFLGQTLVATSDPLQFALDKSKEFFEQVGLNETSASRIISKYEQAVEKYNMSIQKLEYIKDEDEKSKRLQELEEYGKPEIEFSNYLRINTRYHLAKYAKNMMDKVNGKLLRGLYPLEHLPLNMNVPDRLMLLLFAGVGIYSPGHHYIDPIYTDTVLTLASDGQLAFMISDDNICYGANYPFSHVIIDEDIAKTHSINTIFQLAGRSGRVGESWVAYAHIGHFTSDRVMNYIHGTDGDHITEEAKNMNKCFANVVEEVKNMKDTSKNNNDNSNLNNVDYTKVEIISPKNLNSDDIIKIQEIKDKLAKKKAMNDKNLSNQSNSTETTNKYIPPHLRNGFKRNNRG